VAPVITTPERFKGHVGFIDVVGRFRRVLFPALVLALAVSGCSVAGILAPPAQERDFTITVAGGAATPSTLNAYENDTLKITVVVDRTEAIHLSAYDKTFAAAPGKPVTLTFKADRTGSFEYAIKATSHRLGFLNVQPR
jgi:hypothetical protein